ncbi:unnamed protein product, partial [Oppiella nova]
RRETSVTKKDKTVHCNTIADIICYPSLRNIEDFHKFLGIAIETFLVCCDDSDSDVRMTANECLNRTIKNLMDTQLGRIQVELYKEIKKNGSSRSLRAALSRFADLAHLTRPAKCRPYVLNLFPSLVKISERTEEDLIQDTLRVAMTKIMPILAPFATDNEIISLLNAFLPNLQFVMSSVRRTAASSLVIVCQYSRKPQIFFSWLLTHLLQSLNQMNAISETNDNSLEAQTSDRLLVGIFLCLKHMIPHLHDIPSHVEYESLKTFGVSQKQRELIAKDYDTITENLLQMFELILHNIRYNNNNIVIVSALEALQQLMKTPPKLILPYLCDPKGIDKSRIGSYMQSTPVSPMLSLHRNKGRMQSTNSLSCSSINVESLGEEEVVNICGITSLEDKMDPNISYFEDNPQTLVESQQLDKSLDDLNGSDITSEYENNESMVETPRVESDKNFVFESETTSVKHSRHSSMSFQMTKLTYCDSEDMNDIQISPSNTDASFDAIDDQLNNSSVAIKQSLIGLKICLKSCLESKDSINLYALSLMDQLIGLKDNPYWLIKTELVDVFSQINYKTIHYFETSKSELKNGIIVKKESLQKRILNEVFLPLLADEDFRSLKTFGVSQKQRELIAKDYDTITENLLQMFELILHNIRYNNNNIVIVSALEALQQLMKTPPKLILPYLCDPKGIDKSRIGSYMQSTPVSPMLSLHRNKGRMQSTNSLSCSSINVESLGEEEVVNICGITSLEDKMDPNISYFEDNPQTLVESQQLDKSLDDLNGSDITSEYENNESMVETPRVESDKNFVFESETTSVKHSRHSSMSFQMTKLTYCDSEDMNDIQISPSNTDASFDAIDDQLNNSSVAIKQSLIGLKICLKSCLESKDSINLYALSLMDQLIGLKDNPYWLIKTELVDVFSQINYKTIHYFETSKSELKNGIIVKKESLQKRILNEVFLPLLADEDFRVREASAHSLCNLIPVLFTPSILLDNDPITAIAFEHTINNLSQKDLIFKDFESDVPPIKAFIDPLNSQHLKMDPKNRLIEANLSDIVMNLLNALQFNLDDKHALIGYCNALALLSNKYPVTEYPNCWGTELSETSTGMRLLDICITLLSTSTLIVLDLSAHQSVLTLTANILEGLAYNAIKTNFKDNIAFAGELEWGLISHVCPHLAQQSEALFTHLLRIMNIYSSIIDEPLTTTNIMSSLTNYNKMPVIQTLSNSPLSPMRKRSSLKTSDLTDKIDIMKKSDSDKSDKFTKFGSNTLFVRLSEMIRASYLSNKTSMDLSGDKMSVLLNITLNVFGRLLELSTIKYISKYAEEILHYLKIVFTLEPSLSVKNVRQLLKCIFGTNFIIMFTNNNKNDDNEVPEEDVTANENSTPQRNPFTNGIPNYLETDGLYNTCLSSPYAKFTQFYASMSARMNSSFGSTDEMDLTFCGWLRKKIEKRVSGILDKNISSGNSSAGLNSKASLTSHIRLFEPVVIKALKQYTITSDVQLQCEVLDLLSQLVQLRVNYCLLDSEQIFIGFVLKQFEFIESGHLDRYDQLIGHIFFFLILLSYERYHSKPIIGIPKIIQLCDGILASGQYPQKFALPSLQPIVEDLILLRNASKVDSSKELEAQREVIVANCLKLVQFPEILQILVIVTKQSKKDGEEKWKKISRQITDILLPQLVKQSVQIDSYEALEQLHQLFECVSPSVFRPVDILLKALFAAPQPDIIDNYYYFHRWTSLILVILRLLIVQVKEEVVLARLQDIRSSIVTIGPFGLPVIPTSSSASTNAIPFHMTSISNRNDSLTLESEEMFAEYLLQIIELCSHEISIRMNTIYEDIRKHCHFLIQQLANYMLILTHMFQSGSFRRVAKAAMNLIKNSKFDECLETDDTNSYLNGFSLQKTNCSFLDIMSDCPTLALQWFNLLMLLNYEDNNEDGLWNQLIRPNNNSLSASNSKLQTNSKRRGSVNKTKNGILFSPSVEIIRRGSLILFCDFVCENMNDAEHMTWLIVQNINQMIKLCHELPVSEFICAIHRNSASSGLFIQAINARCDENLRIGSFCRRLLHCLGRVHPTQSVSLITFLIEKIISNPNLQSNCLLMSETENLVIKRLNSMTTSLESYSNQSTNQLTSQDLDKLLLSLNPLRYSKLISCLELFRADSKETKSLQTSHPLIDSPLISEIPDLNKEWFLIILSKYCQKHSKGHRGAHLLNKLSYDDIVSIMSSKEFALELLGDCIAFGDQIIEEDDKSSTKIMFSAVMNRINLLKASLNGVLQHVSYFINILPVPHFAFLPHSEMITPKEARHRDKLIELFSQTSLWNYLFKLSNGFLAFLEHHSERSIATDLLANIIRITVFYAEALQYMTETIKNVSFTHLIIVLRIMKSAFNCNSIFTYLSTHENISYQCSIISAVHSFTQLFFGDLPKLEEPQSFVNSEKENPEWKHPHRACIRSAQLVCFLENDKHHSRCVPPVMRNLLKKVILLTARLPLVNSFIMVPISVWNFKNDGVWNPTFSGDFGTVVPTIPSEYLHYKEILNQFSFRVMSLGWNSRVQFEEIWMTLLGVLGANSAYVESAEDQSERINICITATKAITELLLLSTLSPQPGNPIKSRFVYQKNEKMATFLHSTHGVKLQLVREPLISAISSLTTTNDESLHNVYDLGQICIQLLRHSIKSSNSNELSPSLSSTSSSSDYSPLSPVNTSNINKNMSTNSDKLEIDLNSCLHFLLDLFGQLLTAQQSMQLPLLTEICKSIVFLSDLFTERIQFEWLLDTFLELHRMAQISEDEIMSQYLIVGICKSSAVLGLENEQIVDKCKKCIEASLKSHYLPTRIATIHGLKYILEFRGIGSNGRETAFLPIASDYILKHLSDNTM